jgi:hypothetical protein
MAEREFTNVESELGKTLSKLRETTDPSHRKRLLREMRLLLSEADQILGGTEPSSAA